MKSTILIDGSHPEETRVAIVSQNSLEEYDIETSHKRSIKGNIYLAKVIRVEPSLQAAFVEYGGGRHGFLAFNEIHPDYFRIPIEDRKRLEESEETELASMEEQPSSASESSVSIPLDLDEPPSSKEPSPPEGDTSFLRVIDTDDATSNDASRMYLNSTPEKEDLPEDERPNRSQMLRVFHSKYKIQEVIKSRQILLIQATKEERGNKGAALTTFISLAGRYCVLMPNALKGGGVSRKITDIQNRKRLRSLLADFDLPPSMSVIVRTAGMERTKAEIKRDLDYLLKLWSDIRETTLTSIAPALIYREGDLIKRALRDLYTKETQEIYVEGEEAYTNAKNFMKLLIPSHARKIQLYTGTLPLFQKFKIQDQIDEIHNPVVQLKSGGYIVINPTEALTAIDVNSGRSNRERHIDETALNTNLEAALEVARQVRLRDIAGLIVIDFIDMSDSKHNHQVERCLKEAIKKDRARIQIGRISMFGLLEFSRQRLRPTLLESSSTLCRHCGGTGLVRSTESYALHILRSIEDILQKNAAHLSQRTGDFVVYAPTAVILYILNSKKEHLYHLEVKFGLQVNLLMDDTMIPPNFRTTLGDILPALEKSSSGASQKTAPKAETSEIKTAGAGNKKHSTTRDNSHKRRRKGNSHRRPTLEDSQKSASFHTPSSPQENPLVHTAEEGSSPTGQEPEARPSKTPSSAAMPETVPSSTKPIQPRRKGRYPLTHKRVHWERRPSEGTPSRPEKPASESVNTPSIPPVTNTSLPLKSNPSSVTPSREPEKGQRRKGWWQKLLD